MAMRATVPRYTLQDLDSFPDDGNRYELVDGILLVTPAPLLPHDVVVMRLIRTLNLYFGPEPAAWVSGHGVVEVMPNVHMEPDVLVMPAGFVATPALPGERREEDRIVWQPPEMPNPLVVDVTALFEGVTGDD
jgi:Uma2 family endonuclease